MKNAQEKINSYRDLLVWQKGIQLTKLVYKITESFPQKEIYGITSQMRRASVSIPSNIAEGSIRGNKKDFCHFLRISLGSLAELQTQIEIVKNLPFGESLDYNEIEALTTEIARMIQGLISKLKSNSSSN